MEEPGHSGTELLCKRRFTQSPAPVLRRSYFLTLIPHLLGRACRILMGLMGLMDLGPDCIDPRQGLLTCGEIDWKRGSSGDSPVS